MYLIDTHAHLYAEEFDADRSEMMIRAMNAGVSKILLPNIDASSATDLLKLKSLFPENIFAMMGLHPCSVTQDFKKELESIKSMLFSGVYNAIGEIGIDLYWDKTKQKEQEEAFLIQCNWALELNLPIAIHSRNAHNEIIAVLKTLKIQPGGVFHCFGGSIEEADEILALGYSLGIGGIVTYKKSLLPDVLKQIELKHILLETDSPYLPPVPFRGKRNESSYIPYICAKLAEIYGVSGDEIARITSANAEKVFNLTPNQSNI